MTKTSNKPKTTAVKNDYSKAFDGHPPMFLMINIKSKGTKAIK